MISILSTTLDYNNHSIVLIYAARDRDTAPMGSSLDTLLLYSRRLNYVHSAGQPRVRVKGGHGQTTGLVAAKRQMAPARFCGKFSEDHRQTRNVCLRVLSIGFAVS